MVPRPQQEVHRLGEGGVDKEEEVEEGVEPVEAPDLVETTDCSSRKENLAVLPSSMRMKMEKQTGKKWTLPVKNSKQ